MLAAETIQNGINGFLNLRNRMADIAQAVSIGPMRKGDPGSIAVEYDTEDCKIIARYAPKATEDPPPTEIEIKGIGTQKPEFQCKDKIYALETLPVELIRQRISSVRVETQHAVFWHKEEVYVLEILLYLLTKKNITFTTKTGDGSGENPIIILRWERETKEQARQ